MTEIARIRPSARVILLDRERRVLLFRARIPERPGEAPRREFWITPGGGLEGDETYEDGAKRELFEETGLSGIALGPCVWLRDDTFRFNGVLFEQHERFYLVEVESHDVTADGHTEEELTFLRGHRWWSVDEIRASDEVFVPRDFASLVSPLVEGKVPARPLTVGR